MVHENASSFTAMRLSRGLPWPLSHVVPHRTRLAYWWQHRDLARRTVDDVSAVWSAAPLSYHAHTHTHVGWTTLNTRASVHCSQFLGIDVVVSFTDIAGGQTV